MYGLTEDENGEPYNGKSELIMAKHRNGQTGIIPFRFNPSLTAVYDEDFREYTPINNPVNINPNSRIEPNQNFENEIPF